MAEQGVHQRGLVCESRLDDTVSLSSGEVPSPATWCFLHDCGFQPQNSTDISLAEMQDLINVQIQIQLSHYLG